MSSQWKILLGIRQAENQSRRRMSFDVTRLHRKGIPTTPTVFRTMAGHTEMYVMTQPIRSALASSRAKRGAVAIKTRSAGILMMRIVPKISRTPPLFRAQSAGVCYEAATENPSKPQCNQNLGGGSHEKACQDPAYPVCKDFFQGQQWGKCYTVVDANPNTSEPTCNADNGDITSCLDEEFPTCKYERCYADIEACFLPEPWYDVTIWGDSIAFQVHWDDGSSDHSCTGTVNFEMVGSQTHQSTADFTTENQLSVLLTGEEGGSILTDNTGNDVLSDITVTSPTASGIVERDIFGDVTSRHGPMRNFPSWVIPKVGCGNRRPWEQAGRISVSILSVHTPVHRSPMFVLNYSMAPGKKRRWRRFPSLL